MRWSLPRGTRLLLILIPFCAAVLPAQQSRKTWKFASAFSLAAELDNNPFLLSPTAKDRLVSPPASTPASRYANMEKASDLVTKLRAELEFRGPGLFGQTMAIIPEFGYDNYAANGERSFSKGSIALAQSLGRGSRIRVKAEFTPSTFFKNYLSDATDANGDGAIALSERVYKPGSSTERTITADYIFRLKKSRKASPTGAFLRVGAGHAAESYEAPFSVRDRAGPFASLGVALDRGRLELDVGYDYASLGATPSRAVRLLDEPAFGVDFNGNGRTTDLNARAFEMVDYSRTEHGLSLGGRFPMGKRTTMRADFEHRRRSFGSEQPYDVSNRGRADWRNSVGAGASFKLAKSLSLATGLVMQKQTLNKPLDTTGDVADYSRLRLTTGLTYTP